MTMSIKEFLRVNFREAENLVSKIEIFRLFDNFWTFIQLSQKLAVILPNTKLKPTPTLFES